MADALDGTFSAQFCFMMQPESLVKGGDSMAIPYREAIWANMNG